jgi:putative ABC transport system permease protein
MRQLRAMWVRVMGLLRRGRAEDEFAAELESHLALHVEDGMRAGLNECEARRQALIRLGGAERARQAHRDGRGILWLESLAQDLHYGVRTLCAAPGFTTTAVLTLGLGIGACTAIFSLVNAVLIRSLPYGDPGRLVYLFTPNPRFNVPVEVFGPSYGDFYDIKRQSHSFQAMTIFGQATYNVALRDTVERVGAAKVDGDFFRTLQSPPELGRTIGPDDDQPGRDKVVVLSHSLWLSMFGGRADILNQSMPLNGERYQVIGVMPAGFEYPRDSDVLYGLAVIKATQIWVPLALTPQQKADRDDFNGNAIARLSPGVSRAQAQAEMRAIMVRLDALHTERGWAALVKDFITNAVGPVQPLMRLLLAAVAVVLLIACGNAASLLLARSSARERELGVRAALGARRFRIVRQLLTESVLIGTAGGVVGIGLAFAFLRVLPHLDPGNIPRLNEASIDARVLLFALGASLVTSLITGVLPALNVSRLQLAGSLRAHSANQQAKGHTRLQSGLIMMQTAMVVVLLAVAGLLIRSYIKVISVDTGFSQSAVTFNLSLDSRYGPGEPRHAFFKQLLSKLNALPGVQAAGAVSDLPLSNSESLSSLWVDGFPNKKEQLAEARSVSPGYFSAMEIPLVAGRLFTDADETAHGTAIINQRFVRTYFADRKPLGAHISGDDSHKKWDTVIGVVADVRHSSLEADPEPQMYRASYDFDGAYIAVRSSLPVSALEAAIRSTLKTIDPNLAVTDVRTMGELMSRAAAQRRFQTSLLTAFAAIAQLLALVGLYGLMAYSVSRRTREVGIRMALGAQRSDVLMLVLKSAGFLVSSGLVIGLVFTWIAARVISSFLFGVGMHDPATIAVVSALLLVCGLLAAFVPARRASSTDPMQALRTE